MKDIHRHILTIVTAIVDLVLALRSDGDSAPSIKRLVKPRASKTAPKE